MPGEITATAKAAEQLLRFMNTIADYFIDPQKWASRSLDQKLDVIRDGINVAIEVGDWAMVDKWLAAYRILHQQARP